MGGVGRPGQGVAEGDDALGVEGVAEDLVGEGAEVVQPQPRQASTSRSRMGKLGGRNGHAPSSASGPECPHKNEGTPQRKNSAVLAPRSRRGRSPEGRDHSTRAPAAFPGVP